MYPQDFARSFGDRIHYIVATTTLLAALPADELLPGRVYPVTAGPETYQYTASTYTAEDGVVPATNGGTFVRIGSAGAGGASAAAHVVRLATQAALPGNTRTGNVLTAAAPGALAAIDGQAAVATNRILVRNEGGGASHANNGIYVLDDAGGAGPWIMTRIPEFDDTSEVQPACLVMVSEGGVAADGIYILNTNAPIAINATALQFIPAGVLALGATGAMTAESPDVANAAGIAGTAAPIDHVHGAPCAAPAVTAAGLNVSATPVKGAAVTFAISDHAHTVGLVSALYVGQPCYVRIPFTNIGGGADDVTVWNTNCPFALRLLDLWIQVSNIGAGGGTLTARDAAGGGGAALSSALSTAATGVVRNNILTGLGTVALNGSMYLRRTDGTCVGEFVALVQRIP